MLAAARAITAQGVPVALHAITDGRDVAPNSAADFIAALMVSLPQGAKVATVIGRYWAMDRDTRWERVARAFQAMVNAQGEHAATPQAAVAASYAKGEMDESLLEKREGSLDNDTETTSWVEYWLDGEMVHRSVHMALKRSVFADGISQQI